MWRVERLTVCSECGDTYPANVRDGVEDPGVCSCGKPGVQFVLADVCDEHAAWLESVIATIPEDPVVRLTRQLESLAKPPEGQ